MSDGDVEGIADEGFLCLMNSAEWLMAWCLPEHQERDSLWSAVF